MVSESDNQIFILSKCDNQIVILSKSDNQMHAEPKCDRDASITAAEKEQTRGYTQGGLGKLRIRSLQLTM